CSPNLLFDSGSVVSMTGSAASIGSINGLGTNVLTFSVTSTTPGDLIEEDDTFEINGDHAITGTNAPVNCAVALYDQPSQAQNGGTAGLIQNTGFQGPYIAFAPALRFLTTPYEAVANVES